MKNIKIMVCHHKKSVFIKNNVFFPIHCGRSVGWKNFHDYCWLKLHMSGDNTGDNISFKNPIYNELTAVYWAWKNYKRLGNPDYIGLMHYRRHFIFKEDPEFRYMIKYVDSINDVEEYLEKISYSEENLDSLLDKYNFLCFQGKVESVYKNFGDSHPIEDLDKAISILKKLFPQYSETCDEYMAGDTGVYYNMFVFTREIFFQYCEWIFSILTEYERQVDCRGKRFFISERLMGVFLLDLIKSGYKCGDLPIAFVKNI